VLQCGVAGGLSYVRRRIDPKSVAKYLHNMYKYLHASTLLKGTNYGGDFVSLPAVENLSKKRSALGVPGRGENKVGIRIIGRSRSCSDFLAQQTFFFSGEIKEHSSESVMPNTAAD
jgi:hypothetical protein